MKLISVIFRNLFGYDILIFIAAIFTAVIYRRLKQSADKLYKKMHLTVFVPDGGNSRREAEREISGLREQDVVAMRNHTGRLYSVFVNLTGIFPLLGILGTVVSLLGLVADDTNVTGNFYGALTSTFWGLVFAIIFKFMDGMVSAKIEDNEKTVELFLTRNYKSREAEEESGREYTARHSEVVRSTYRRSDPVNEKEDDKSDILKGLFETKPAKTEKPEKTETAEPGKKGLALFRELFLGDPDDVFLSGDDDEEE